MNPNFLRHPTALLLGKGDLFDTKDSYLSCSTCSTAIWQGTPPCVLEQRENQLLQSKKALHGNTAIKRDMRLLYILNGQSFVDT